MCSYVALRQHKEQSTSHLFFVEWEQSATQHNETTYPNCTRQNENGTKWLSRKASTRLLPAAFIVIEQHWPKIKSCCSYRVFMKSICQITFSVVSRFLLMAAARIGRDEQNIQGNRRGRMTTGGNHVIRKLNCGGAAKIEKKKLQEKRWNPKPTDAGNNRVSRRVAVRGSSRAVV